MTGLDAPHPGPTEPPAPSRTPHETAPAPSYPDPVARLEVAGDPTGSMSPFALTSREAAFSPPPPRPPATRDPAPDSPLAIRGSAPGTAVARQQPVPHHATERLPSVATAPAPPPRPSTARQSVPPMAALQSLRRPRVVIASFWCWLVGSLLVAGPVLLASTKVDVMRAEFARLAAESDPGAPAATIDRVAGVSVLIVVGTGAALGVLGLLLAGPLRAGRNWARVLLTPVALVAVVYAAFVTTAVTDAMLDGLRATVSTGLLAYTAAVLAATVCMFLPSAKPWFHRPKRT